MPRRAAFIVFQETAIESIKSRLEKDKTNIISQHLAGASCTELATKWDCGSGNIWQLLEREGVLQRKHTVCNRTSVLDEHKDEIIRRYLAGEGSVAIARDLGGDFSTLLRKLRKWGYSTKTKVNKYPLHEDYFERIDTPDKAYVLGLLMADGCVFGTSLKLSMIDRHIVEDVRLAIGWEGPLLPLKPRAEKCQTQYLLSVTSKKMTSDLVRAGCVPRKSHLAEFQSDEIVPPVFHRHLIRGWFDGDGCVSKQTSPIFAVCGTDASMRGMGACLERHLGVKPGYSTSKKINMDLTVVRYSSRANFALVHEWLYAEGGMQLNRKRAKFDEILGFFAGGKQSPAAQD